MTVIVSIAFASALFQASPQTPAPPPGLAAVLACRTIQDATERLACFDGSVAAFDEAQKQGRIAVVDRQQIDETRRESFGFTLPSLTRAFGAAAGTDLDQIETTLASARQVGVGTWVFRLSDGSVWRQTDSGSFRFREEPGQPVRVRRAALGSFLMTIGSSRAVRVRRE